MRPHIAARVSGGGAENAELPELVYTLAYRAARGRPRFDISLSFRGNAAGRTRIRLPSRWAGQRHFYEAIRLVGPATPRVAIGDSASPSLKVVSHPPGEVVTIRYQLSEQTPGDIGDFSRCYWPILRDDYFHFIGEAFFVHPDWDDARPRRVMLRWGKTAEGWALCNSFGARQQVQVFTTTLSRLRNAVYLGGDFRVNKVVVRNRPVYVAIRGAWNFSDRKFLQVVRKVVDAERRFWDDHDFPHFLISLIPTDQPHHSYGGTGLTDSFAAFVSSDRQIDWSLKHLLAHELFHTWNGGKIRAQKPEELIYWFTEGFTEYYSRLLLLRAGLITFDEYVETYNRVLREYYSSPFRHLGNHRILKGYWNDERLRTLPYQRGDILAHNWNALIRAGSRGRRSLDDLMAELFRAGRVEGRLISHATIGELLRDRVGYDASRDITRYVDEGELIEPSETALGRGAKLERAKVERFDLGFDDQKSFASGRVQSVRRGSNAFHAGLRDGQRILCASIFYNNPSRDVEIRVRGHAGDRLIKFHPFAEPVIVPRYELNSRLLKKDPQAWRAWFDV